MKSQNEQKMREYMARAAKMGEIEIELSKIEAERVRIRNKYFKNRPTPQE